MFRSLHQRMTRSPALRSSSSYRPPAVVYTTAVLDDATIVARGMSALRRVLSRCIGSLYQRGDLGVGPEEGGPHSVRIAFTSIDQLPKVIAFIQSGCQVELEVPGGMSDTDAIRLFQELSSAMPQGFELVIRRLPRVREPAQSLSSILP